MRDRGVESLHNSSVFLNTNTNCNIYYNKYFIYIHFRKK